MREEKDRIKEKKMVEREIERERKKERKRWEEKEMMGRWEREDKDEDERNILKIYIWEDE